MHQGSESNAISILCMYVLYMWRIDNKARLDLTYNHISRLELGDNIVLHFAAIKQQCCCIECIALCDIYIYIPYFI